MKILPLEAKLFHAGGRADGRTDRHGEGKSRCSAISWTGLKKNASWTKIFPGFPTKRKSPKVHSISFKCFVDRDLNGAQVNWTHPASVPFKCANRLIKEDQLQLNSRVKISLAKDAAKMSPVRQTPLQLIFSSLTFIPLIMHSSCCLITH